MRVVQKESGIVAGVMKNCQILIIVLRFSQSEMCQCPDRMLERSRVSTPTWEEQIRKAEELIERSGSTALKGIPGPLEEPDRWEDSIPAAQVVHPLPRVVEMCPGKDGDELSVFANLTKELDGPAAEAQASP